MTVDRPRPLFPFPCQAFCWGKRRDMCCRFKPGQHINSLFLPSGYAQRLGGGGKGAQAAVNPGNFFLSSLFLAFGSKKRTGRCLDCGLGALSQPKFFLFQKGKSKKNFGQVPGPRGLERFLVFLRKEFLLHLFQAYPRPTGRSMEKVGNLFAKENCAEA